MLSAVVKTEPHVRRQPRFAVVTLNESSNVAQLFNDLIQSGYSNVAFLNDLTEHPEIQRSIHHPPPQRPPSSSSSIPSSPDSLPTSKVKKEPAQQLTDSRHTTPSPTQLKLNAELATLFDQTIEHVIATSSNPSELLSDPSALIRNLFEKDNSEQAIQPRVHSTSRKTYESKEGEFTICRMCENKIMVSRYSNLSNHVRRHAQAKQYQCAHCNYQNNEQAKVRLHMANQHGDRDTQALDKLTPEMLSTWNELMESCFPEYAKFVNQKEKRKTRTSVEKDTSESSNSNSNQMPESEDIKPASTITHNYNCTACDKSVSLGEGHLSKNEALVKHLRKFHSDDCKPFECDECGYKNAEQWKVRWHITARHAEADVDVITAKTPSVDLFVHKFFPTAIGVELDTEEAELLLYTERGNLETQAAKLAINPKSRNRKLGDKDSGQKDGPQKKRRRLK